MVVVCVAADSVGSRASGCGSLAAGSDLAAGVTAALAVVAAVGKTVGMVDAAAGGKTVGTVDARLMQRVGEAVVAGCCLCRAARHGGV